MQANTICKYSKCSLGKNGGRKHYYSCGFCVVSENWKSMACCKEHYNLYLQEVLASRKNGIPVDLLPDRTDMTKEELRSFKKKPLAQAKKETEDELKDYADADGTVDFGKAADQINQELDLLETKRRNSYAD